jgi:pyridoxine 4-dehydrogenase
MTYRLVGKDVARIGYGAMQLAGPGVFGPPRDHDEAVTVFQAAVDAGINHIDTAHYYGPAVVNDLIREALHPHPDDLALVSKVSGLRDAVGGYLPYNRPDQLRAGIEDNLISLGVDRLTAVNLRLLDGAPVDQRFVDQLGALDTARDDGLTGGIGITNITHQHLLLAVEVTHIVCVQNSLSLADQSGRTILDACAARGIAFVPSGPLGSMGPAQAAIRTNPVVTAVAGRRGATPGQVALAWLLVLAENVLPIPGTGSRTHLAENLADVSLRLSVHEMNRLTVASAEPRRPGVLRLAIT